jgi:hypothetical protein
MQGHGHGVIVFDYQDFSHDSPPRSPGGGPGLRLRGDFTAPPGAAPGPVTPALHAGDNFDPFLPWFYDIYDMTP